MRRRLDGVSNVTGGSWVAGNETEAPAKPAPERSDQS
jgi:hypothetical protein